MPEPLRPPPVRADRVLTPAQESRLLTELERLHTEHYLAMEALRDGRAGTRANTEANGMRTVLNDVSRLIERFKNG